MTHNIQKPPKGYLKQRYAIYCTKNNKRQLFACSDTRTGIVIQLAKDDPEITNVKVVDTGVD